MTGHVRNNAEIAICAELFVKDQLHGPDVARMWALGFIAGAAAFLEKKDGALEAYGFIQLLADSIAERIPARAIQVTRRK